MKIIFQYFRFFFYVAFNWSIWLALFVLFHDIRGALQYGIMTFMPVKLTKLTIHSGDISKSSNYEAVNYFMLEQLLTAFRKLSSAESIVDLGCGKGRVMVVAAYFGFTKITGIDFAKELTEEASQNMKKVQKKNPQITWKVIHANVLDYTISPADNVFFMFNPFVEEILATFLGRLEISCKLFPRKTYFLYASPQHADVLRERGYQEVFRISMLDLEGMILVKD